MMLLLGYNSGGPGPPNMFTHRLATNTAADQHHQAKQHQQQQQQITSEENSMLNNKIAKDGLNMATAISNFIYEEDKYVVDVNAKCISIDYDQYDAEDMKNKNQSKNNRIRYIEQNTTDANKTIPPTLLANETKCISSSSSTTTTTTTVTANQHEPQPQPNTRVPTSNVSSATRFVNKIVASKWFFTITLIFAILSQTAYPVAAEKSKHYYMQSLCKNHFLQQLYRKIDGAVLWSQNERNLDCIITFQTHSILQRFMLRFDMLQLDCNDHLYVYDGAHAVATPKVDISCRNTKQTVSSILTRTNFVTLKYVTDNWGTDANGFKLVITSVKDPKHTCKDFTCATREFCIHPDLLCDGINHCGDNSDESVHNLCQNETSSTIFGMDTTWFVLIVVSVLLIFSTIVVAISICACRRQNETTASNPNMTAIQLHHGAETNGSSKYLHHYHVYGGTLTREHTQLPPQLSTSGNWHHPAGLLGYHRIPRNLLKMATKVRPIWCLANSVN